MKTTHLIIIIIIFVSFIFILGSGSEQVQVLNFDECVASGEPVMESYPRACQSNGITYVEDIGNELEQVNIIRIDSPRPNQRIASPLIIRGQAVGTWFFEGDFPIKILDANGEVLGEGFASAGEDSYTEDFVSFLASLNFKNSSTTKGNLFLIKDNPSGDPDNDDMLRVPVVFEVK